MTPETFIHDFSAPGLWARMTIGDLPGAGGVEIQPCQWSRGIKGHELPAVKREYAAWKATVLQKVANDKGVTILAVTEEAPGVWIPREYAPEGRGGEVRGCP